MLVDSVPVSYFCFVGWFPSDMGGYLVMIRPCVAIFPSGLGRVMGCGHGLFLSGCCHDVVDHVW